MTDSPKKPRYERQRDQELLEQLCLELRYVGCMDYTLLTLGSKAVGHIEDVCKIFRELESRGIDTTPRISRLSEETKWDIHGLLADCLHFPDVIPLVRAPDGIRRCLRCCLCRTKERPVDSRVMYYCNDCMHSVLESIDKLEPTGETILYKTYNPECRCAHADADTVLVVTGLLDTLEGVCRLCITDELLRRGALAT